MLFADAVNPDYVKGAGFGNRFPANPVTYLLFWFIAPSIQPITLYMAPLQLSPDDNPYVPDYNHRYSYIVSRNRWYETAINEVRGGGRRSDELITLLLALLAC